MKRLEQQLRSLLGSSRGGGAPAAAEAAEGDSTTTVHEGESESAPAAAPRPLAASRFVLCFHIIEPLWREIVSCSLLPRAVVAKSLRVAVARAREGKRMSTDALAFRRRKRFFSFRSFIPFSALSRAKLYLFFCWGRAWRSVSSRLKQKLATERRCELRLGQRSRHKRLLFFLSLIASFFDLAHPRSLFFPPKKTQKAETPPPPRPKGPRSTMPAPRTATRTATTTRAALLGGNSDWRNGDGEKAG